VEGPARPGQSVTGWLQLPGQAKKGFTILSSALIRFGYQSWVFLETEPGEYKRIAMDSISSTATGWFVEKSELKADSKVVVTGAQAVMSAEVGPAEEEE
jgi:hypothetical protein